MNAESARALERAPQLSDRAALYIRDQIITGKLQAGEFIRIQPLAAQLGVSTNPVREALVALREAGFVQLHPHRGYVVASLDRQDAEDLLFISLELSGELAARAAPVISADQLGGLADLIDDFERASRRRDLTEMESLHSRFLRSVNRAAAAPKLAWLLGAVSRYAPRWEGLEEVERIPASIGPEGAQMQRVILAALTDRDPERAREGMQRYIRYAGERLMACVDRWVTTDVTKHKSSEDGLAVHAART